jgi:cobalt-precorrin-5B (C1)-methyltransferase
MVAPRSGYTLPVFACAAAIAALQYLREAQPIDIVTVDLIQPATTVEIPIEQVAQLQAGAALAITRSDPGDNLDLTRHTPIWAMVSWVTGEPEGGIILEGGDGIGIQQDGAAAGQAAIYAYAQDLMQTNLAARLRPGEAIRVRIILPEGRRLAKRTSNEAFGVVEGLSLLGTTGIAQPLSAPGQLEAFRADLQAKGHQGNETVEGNGVVFCIGENGLDLAAQMGIPAERRVKTANWLGPLLVEAGLQQISSVLLFGYHGKLLKLAGGIFHTHHHVADARQEILTAYSARAGLPTADLQTIFAAPTAEAGLAYLQQLDQQHQTHWVEQVYGAIATAIDQRAQDYIRTHSEANVQVGTVLFDRQRRIILASSQGGQLLRDRTLHTST